MTFEEAKELKNRTPNKKFPEGYEMIAFVVPENIEDFKRFCDDARCGLSKWTDEHAKLYCTNNRYGVARLWVIKFDLHVETVNIEN